MKKTMLLLITVIATGIACAQSLERAELFKDHGLADDAKREFILIVTSSADNATKARAYYLLGAVAFEQNHISAALSSWRTLASKFSDAKEAKEVAGRLKDLAQIAGDIQKESLDNAVAQAYIRNGNFWSKGKAEIFSIDTSYITNVDTAAKWYDKTIAEFPKSIAARVAYEEKLRTLLGWKEPGQYGNAHGLRRDFEKYMPILLSTFETFERDFPEAGTLQAFRYQIAQAYWNYLSWKEPLQDPPKWENAKKWLNLIIEKDAGTDSFYADLAKRRLENPRER